MPEFANYGPVLSSSTKPVQLTESETEYQVSCVKHIFKEHVVFQFNVSNTIPDTLLEQVAVMMQPSDDDAGLTEDFIMPIATVTVANSPGTVYASFTRDVPEDYQMSSFQCTLKFVSKEVDPSTGEPEAEGYEDEYQLEDTELSAADYIIPSYVTFASEWDRMRGGVNVTETFSLPAMESLKGKTPYFCWEKTAVLKQFVCSQPRATPSSRFSTCNRWVGQKSHKTRTCTRFRCQVW